jgi:hypothetical protein
MEKISWTNHVRNEEVLHTIKEERNIPHTINIWKDNCIGHTLHRKSFKRIIEHKIEGGIWVLGRQDSRCKQLLDDFREKEDTGNSKRRQ